MTDHSVLPPRRLGRADIHVGAIGLGCWAIGGPFWRQNAAGERGPMGWGVVDDTESIRAVHRALDLGVTLFDTANNYGAGHSERILGRALRGRSEDVVVATKFASAFDEQTQTHFDDRTDDLTPSGIRRACDDSLRRLDRETIDLYLFHDGTYDVDRAADVRDALEDLVADGLIRWYGWSTDDPERARLFAQGAHCVAIEHRLNLMAPGDEMLRLCDELDLASIVRSPLNGGILTGKFTATSTFPEDDERHGLDFSQGHFANRLRQVDLLRGAMTGDGRSMSQGALGWILSVSERTIPIPGFKTRSQVEELVAAAAMPPLTEDQLEHVARFQATL